ncbi:hypothetical protein J437_LFUL004402 [Ladona fulva]|uniref:Uncharacterized protein n=1 Tax=Ladona fulva TaxID=123851 RepID=A0A8K0K2R4_LADFU|nr:hypothetical protein J437_LFUL004402 [Ladona fulva]
MNRFTKFSEARCVKCGLSHHSKECSKPISEPAVCANCKGSHPANYRGCPAYQTLKNIIKILKEKARLKINVDRFTAPKVNPVNGLSNFPQIQGKPSYAQATSQDPITAEIIKMRSRLSRNLSNISDSNSNVFTPPPRKPSSSDWRFQIKNWIINLAKVLSDNNSTKEFIDR